LNSSQTHNELLNLWDVNLVGWLAPEVWSVCCKFSGSRTTANRKLPTRTTAN